MEFIKKIIPASIKNRIIILRIIIYRYINSLYKNKDFSPPKKTISKKETHCFFGYYDINPFSYDERYLLGMQTRTPLRSPKSGDILEIGYYDLSLENPTFNKIGETETWCWQQGCRLRWFPSNQDREVIYNKIVGEQYGSIVKNIFNGETQREFPFSLYDIRQDGKVGVTLNFSRLQRLRPGYGYGVLDDKSKNDKCPDYEGVWIADLQKKKKYLLLSLEDLSNIEPHNSMNDAEHYINHFSFNPTGTSFLFFHLWNCRTNKKRYSRLFTVDADGSNLLLINNSGHVSHYAWLTDDRFVITTRMAPGKLRYCLYHRSEGFEKIIGGNVLKEDGHPTFINNGECMITDTYPNKARDQLLMYYDTKSNNVKVIDRFFVPMEFKGEVRCDLHPRPSSTGRLICVDNILNYYRAISIIELQGYDLID